jgi:hypothetical protein
LNTITRYIFTPSTLQIYIRFYITNMFLSSLFAATLALAATTAAAPIEERATTNNFALAIAGARFDPNYLQTFQLSYANNSAYLGQIKYQTYSEPLIVSGAGVNGLGDGLSFQSIHSSPNGQQTAYIVPHQTQPIGFSSPHVNPPAGVRTTGWSFASDGTLLNNGLDLFYACQNAEQAALHSYEVWWWGAGQPNGVSCKGPLQIKKADACAR